MSHPLSLSTRAGRRVLALALCGAAAFHLTWTVAVFSSSTLNPQVSYVSELLAQDQPWSAWLRAGDTSAGIFTLGAALAAWIILRGGRSEQDTRTRRWFAISAAGLGTFGVATFFDSLAPLSCARTASPACEAAEAAGTVPFLHLVHYQTSMVALVGMISAIVAGTVVVWRWRPALATWVRPLVTTVAALHALASVWVAVESLGVEPASPFQGIGMNMLGYAHRAQVILTATWLVSIALVVMGNRCTRLQTASAKAQAA